MSEIAYGYCHCGCGQKTNISKQTDPRRGVVKGQPRRFLLGHGTLKKPLSGRFWSKVDKSGGENACWNWTASVNKYGYGKIRGATKMTVSHRAAYELTYGEISGDLWVLHSCDNPKCCNPKHLFLGTHQDNEVDKVSKGRHAWGERNGSHKLTWEQVKYIRARYSEGGITYRELALEMGVTRESVANIVTRKSWVVKCERCGDHGYTRIVGDDDTPCHCNEDVVELEVVFWHWK